MTKYRVTSTLKSKKLIREFISTWDMKEYIRDWGEHGIDRFKIEVIKEKK